MSVGEKAPQVIVRQAPSSSNPTSTSPQHSTNKQRTMPPPPLPQPTRTAVRPSLAPSNAKARQVSHLHSQLAQLQAALADLEDISRVTAVQAENIKALGSLNGAL